MFSYRPMLTPNWIPVFAGLFLLTVPVLMAFPTSSLLIGYHLGVSALIFGVGAAAVASRNSYVGMINVPLGIFMISLPLLLGYAGFTAVLWTSIGVGALVAITAAGSPATEELVARTGAGETREETPTDISHRRGRKAA